MRSVIRTTIVCLLATCACRPAELLKSRSLIETGYHQMYDLQFAQARSTITDWQARNPGDPLGPASLAAAYLFE